MTIQVYSHYVLSILFVSIPHAKKELSCGVQDVAVKRKTITYQSIPDNRGWHVYSMT